MGLGKLSEDRSWETVTPNGPAEKFAEADREEGPTLIPKSLFTTTVPFFCSKLIASNPYRGYKDG